MSAVIEQWQQWLGDATDRLMDLDGRAAGSSDALRLDLAAAFVCRKAIATRVEAMAAAEPTALQLAMQPVVDDQGAPVADDLEGAATLLTAVLDRASASIDGDETVARQIATDLMAATADVATAERLAEQVGQYVQRAAVLRQQLAAAGRQPQALRTVTADAAALRRELEGMVAERDEMFVRWAAVPQTIEQYRVRAHQVQSVVDRCVEKVRPLPTLATPSVDALGAPPSIDDLRAMTWPAARAVMQPMLNRLDRLDDAFDEIERRYSAVLAKRDELRGLLQAFRDKAGGSGLAEHPDLEPAFKAAESELWSAPCDVVRAEGLVADYTGAVNAMIAAKAQPVNDRGAR
jgi:hypothetical protein